MNFACLSMKIGKLLTGYEGSVLLLQRCEELLKIFEHFFLIILGKEGLANFSFNECIYCPK